MDLAPPSERPASHQIGPRRPASPGIRSRGVPHLRHTAERPLPDGVAATVRPEVASSESCSALVVSHHLDGFLRSTAPGLLHPGARRGSLRFTTSLPRWPRPKPSPRAPLVVPPSAVHTPRRTPLICSRTASPRPLPPCRCLRVGRRPACAGRLGIRFPDTFPTRRSATRPCSADESVAPPTVAGQVAPCPSMGLVPLRGPFPAAARRAR
jgi:hypothetical protein